MVNLLGPLTSVLARGRIGAPIRTVTSPGRRVESVTVTTSTHVTAVLEFTSGVIGTLIASYDVWDHHLPHLEVSGPMPRSPATSWKRSKPSRSQVAPAPGSP
jgi:hypothetical protein